MRFVTTEDKLQFDAAMLTHQSNGRFVVAYAIRSDGYRFTLTIHSHNWKDARIYAGCRKAVTLAWYRAHVKTYTGRSKRAKQKETLAILTLFELTLKSCWNK